MDEFLVPVSRIKNIGVDSLAARGKSPGKVRFLT